MYMTRGLSLFLSVRGCRVGSYHLSVDIDTVTGALMALFTATFGQRPRFRVHGGTEPENLALQNVQVRSCASSCHGVRP
jgi:hypothetical protein